MAAKDTGKYHTVDQGDHLASIAMAYGFKNTRAISEHAANKEVFDKRPDSRGAAEG
jgi:hypothetical protein